MEKKVDKNTEKKVNKVPQIIRANKNWHAINEDILKSKYLKNREHQNGRWNTIFEGSDTKKNLSVEFAYMYQNYWTMKWWFLLELQKRKM